MSDAQDDLTAFSRKLVAASLSIKRQAEGKTCGSCAHFRGTWCAEHNNIYGDSLSVNFGSVACIQWRKE